MAAEDEGAEIFIVGTDEVLTAEEERGLLEEEINNGADAVIMQPIPGEDPEEIVEEFGSRIPIMFVEYAPDNEGRKATTSVMLRYPALNSSGIKRHSTTPVSR